MRAGSHVSYPPPNRFMKAPVSVLGGGADGRMGAGELNTSAEGRARWRWCLESNHRVYHDAHLLAANSHAWKEVGVIKRTSHTAVCKLISFCGVFFFLQTKSGTGMARQDMRARAHRRWLRVPAVNKATPVAGSALLPLASGMESKRSGRTCTPECRDITAKNTLMKQLGCSRTAARFN